jgi:hypothetical protein
LTLYTLLITGRSEKVLFPDPKAPSGYRQYVDTTPMRIDCMSKVDALAEIPRLKLIAAKNPSAQIELPDGKKSSLADWIAEATGQKAAEPPKAPEPKATEKPAPPAPEQSPKK